MQNVCGIAVFDRRGETPSLVITFTFYFLFRIYSRRLSSQRIYQRFSGSFPQSEDARPFRETPPESANEQEEEAVPSFTAV